MAHAADFVRVSTSCPLWPTAAATVPPKSAWEPRPQSRKGTGYARALHSPSSTIFGSPLTLAVRILCKRDVGVLRETSGGRKDVCGRQTGGADASGEAPRKPAKRSRFPARNLLPERVLCSRAGSARTAYRFPPVAAGGDRRPLWSRREERCSRCRISSKRATGTDRPLGCSTTLILPRSMFVKVAYPSCGTPDPPGRPRRQQRPAARPNAIDRATRPIGASLACFPPAARPPYGYAHQTCHPCHPTGPSSASRAQSTLPRRGGGLRSCRSRLDARTLRAVAANTHKGPGLGTPPHAAGPVGPGVSGR